MHACTETDKNIIKYQKIQEVCFKSYPMVQTIKRKRIVNFNRKQTSKPCHMIVFNMCEFQIVINAIIETIRKVYTTGGESMAL